MRGLICSINRDLKDGKYPCNIVDDKVRTSRQAVQARSKELKNDGKENATGAITD